MQRGPAAAAVAADGWQNLLPDGGGLTKTVKWPILKTWRKAGA